MTWGSPGAGDPTSRYDAAVNRLAEKAAADMKRLSGEVVNRPIGTREKTLDEQLADYEAMLADPAGAAARLQTEMQQRPESVGEFVKWAAHMKALKEKGR